MVILLNDLEYQAFQFVEDAIRLALSMQGNVDWELNILELNVLELTQKSTGRKVDVLVVETTKPPRSSTHGVELASK